MPSKLAKGEKFEILAVNYLRRKYGQLAKFLRYGGSDSTVPDIKVLTQNNKFYIEVKEHDAQASQFVVKKVKPKTFVPKLNKNHTLKHNKKLQNITKTILLHVSKMPAGNRKETITFNNSENLAAAWIKTYYASNKNKYFITSRNDKQFYIFPINSLTKYFDPYINLRRKRSGTRSFGLDKNGTEKLKVDHYLKTHGLTFNLYKKYSNYKYKLYVKFHGNKKPNFRYFGKNLYFSNTHIPSAFDYEIKKRSSTNNANIIFGISLKKNATQIESDLRKFEDDLN